MLKGAHKRMYVVKMGQDSMFEEAYFVLRRDSDKTQGKDMVSEANRIIRQSAERQSAQKSAKPLPWQIVAGFVGGFVTGGGIAVAICLLL